MLKLDNKLVFNQSTIEAPDLTDRFTEHDLKVIGNDCFRGYEADLYSRSSWERRNEAGMDLAMQITREKTFPWPGASNVIFPLISIAALQFSARSYANLIRGDKIVDYKVGGIDKDGSMHDLAARIARHMSWQVLEEDTSWEEQHDRLLINLSIVGTNFVKTYYSAQLRHNVSELVMARDLVLNYHAKSVGDCPRKTQVLTRDRNEIYERIQTKVYRNVEDEEWFQQVAQPQPPTLKHRQDIREGKHAAQADFDTPYTILEQHRLLDLDSDGYREPYVITLEAGSKSVVRIVARVDREEQVDRANNKIRCIVPSEYYTKYSFIPSPDGGIYDIGFGTLLGPLNSAVNSGINQLIDAGTMANSSGGFLGRGAKIRGGVYTVAPWEWKRVDSTGDDLRKNMVPHQTKEPSATMFQLINLLIEYVNRMSGSTDILVGENPGQNTPATTSNNMIEQGMQVYSAIFKRVWRSMKDEFQALALLNARYLPMKKRFGAQDQFILQEDYKTNLEFIRPVADPKVASDVQRQQKATMIADRATKVPGYDPEVVERNFLRSFDIDEEDMFYPGPKKLPPPPDQKAQAEQMKAQGQIAKMEHEKWMLLTQLRASSLKTAAEIMNLEAQTLKLQADAEASGIQLNMQAYQLALQAMEAHQQAINDRIVALGAVNPGEQNDQSSNDQSPASNDGGGVPGVAQSPGDSGVSPDASTMAGIAQGAMG